MKKTILLQLISGLNMFAMGYFLKSILECRKRIEKARISLYTKLIAFHSEMMNAKIKDYVDCICGTDKEMSYNKSNCYLMADEEKFAIGEVYRRKEKEMFSILQIRYKDIENIQRVYSEDVIKFCENNNVKIAPKKVLDEDKMFIKITYSFKEQKHFLFIGSDIDKKINKAMDEIMCDRELALQRIFSKLYALFINHNKFKQKVGD